MAWTFNLRSGYLSSDSDDPKDDDDSKPASRPHELFDLSSREDHATFVPNPWSLAKLNAASKKKPLQPVKKDPKSSSKPASKPSSKISTKPPTLNDSFPSSDGTLVDENDVPTRTTKPLSSFPTKKSNAKSNNAQKVTAQAPPARIIPSASVKSRPPKLATYKFHRDPVQTKPPPPSKEKVVSNTIDSRISSSTPSDPNQLPATRRLTRDPETSKPPVSTRPEEIFRPVESFVNACTSNTLSESPAWTKTVLISTTPKPIRSASPVPCRSDLPYLSSTASERMTNTIYLFRLALKADLLSETSTNHSNPTEIKNGRLFLLARKLEYLLRRRSSRSRLNSDYLLTRCVLWTKFLHLATLLSQIRS
ncbi:hypothetical protein SISSUDRAFT_58925 [Sistotremastrum suecicum HHB10207 ss-3]|uniref:Uncharacterized protein n=1 Tax=Sistotremastrum suecicum HHB10207 ss-3 TaxID=1314776 RepID=A0A166BND9_9AGAM|nr:hypothetical protein SISSUDRAFT_58925 [Sistotremastrum suecicum HHB10207 ss-3]